VVRPVGDVGVHPVHLLGVCGGDAPELVVAPPAVGRLAAHLAGAVRQAVDRCRRVRVRRRHEQVLEGDPDHRLGVVTERPRERLVDATDARFLGFEVREHRRVGEGVEQRVRPIPVTRPAPVGGDPRSAVGHCVRVGE